MRIDKNKSVLDEIYIGAYGIKDEKIDI